MKLTVAEETLSELYDDDQQEGDGVGNVVEGVETS